MNSILIAFFGFSIFVYNGITSINEFLYYKDLFKRLNIKDNDGKDGLILGYGHTATMKRLKKSNLINVIVSFVSAAIFLWQLIIAIIGYVNLINR